MNKQATDFALMAAAFSADQKMATQVCKLLADGDVNETVARKMLGLVRDGKLKSESPICSHGWYTYGALSNNLPCTTTVTSDPIHIYNNSSTLSEMAQTISENAA